MLRPYLFRLSFALFICCFSTLTAVKVHASEDVVSKSTQVMIKAWYDASCSESGCWQNQGWWNSANTLEVFANVWALRPTLHATLLPIIDNIAAHNDADYINYGGKKYNDDRLWWALAYLRLSRVMHAQYPKRAMAFLENTQAIVTYVHEHSWDPTVCHGGVWWNDWGQYKNAITNELFLAASAGVYNTLPATNPSRAQYLKWAESEWQWFDASGMINKDSLVNDGLDNDCKNNGKTVWSYNQGVILYGLNELSQATEVSQYRKRAIQIASAAIKTPLITKNGILLESCESSICNKDQVQFKGIFVRDLHYLSLSLAATKSPELSAYEIFIHNNAASIQSKDMTSISTFGLHWAGPVDSNEITASTSTSALDALVADAANAQNDQMFWELRSSK